MRRLAPLALAAAVAAVVAGAAFGVQALALRQPHRGDLVAARALERYRAEGTPMRGGGQRVDMAAARWDGRA